MRYPTFPQITRCLVILFLLALSCGLIQPVHAEETTPTTTAEPVIHDILVNPTMTIKPEWSPSIGKVNGIVVGMPKVYSERFLRVTLEQLQQSLRSISFIDPDNIKRSVGVLQGTEAYRQSFGLTLAPAIPSVMLEQLDNTTDKTNGSENQSEKVTTGASPSTTIEHSTGSGGSSERVQGEKTTTTSPSPIKATIPDFTQTALPSSSLGLGAHDVLATQMEMTYQILNLQMMLDRAISDRLVVGEVEQYDSTNKYHSVNADPLDIVILGFQISIDSRHENAVAQVEIAIEPDTQTQNETATTVTVPTRSPMPAVTHTRTPSPASPPAQASTVITSPTGKPPQQKTKTDMPSLVAMFPQEKTYNMAMLTDKVNQFDLGALAPPLAIGMGGKSSDSTVYLMRDVDTVAFQMLPSTAKGTTDTNTLRFGWQFRPVFGKKTVDPGIRQVYAVIAMPKSYTNPESGFHNSDNVASYSFNVTARTTWKRFDRKTRRIGSTLYGTESIIGYDKVRWISGTDMNKCLAPTVLAVDCIDLGDGIINVDVDGENFYHGTQLMVGNKLYAPGTNFQNLDENRLSFRIAASDLLQHVPIIVSEFGEKTPVQQPEPSSDTADQNQQPKLNPNTAGAAIVANPTQSAELAVQSTAQEIEILPAIDPSLCKLEEVGIDQTKVTIGIKNASTKWTTFNLEKSEAPATATTDNPSENAEKISLSYGHIEIPLDGLFVIVAGNQLYGLNNTPVTTSRNTNNDRLFVEFVTSTSALIKNPSITLKSPLGPDTLTSTWSASTRFKDFFIIDTAPVILTKTDVNVEFGIFGRKLDADVKLYIDGQPKTGVQISSSLLKFSVPTELLKKAKTVYAISEKVIPNYGKQFPVLVELKFDLEEKKSALKPIIRNFSPVNQGDLNSVQLIGDNLSSISRVFWQNQELKLWKEKVKDPADQNKVITNYFVVLTEKMTEKPGMRELIFELTDDTTARAAFYVKELKQPEK